MFEGVDLFIGLCYTNSMSRVISSFNMESDTFSFHHTIDEVGSQKLKLKTEVHTVYEFLYVQTGILYFFIDGIIYEATYGDIIVVYPNEIHSLTVDKNCIYERKVFMFDYENLHAFLSKAQSPFLAISQETNKDLRVIKAYQVKKYGFDTVFNRLSAAMDRKEKFPIYALNESMRLLLKLDNLLKDGGIIEQYVEKDIITSQAINYISKNIFSEIDIDKLAKELFISKSTLYYHFVSHVHIPLGRYIQIAQMCKAEELIRRGKPIKEVCELLGYEYYATFYNVFKRIKGYPPSKIQKERQS